MYDALASGDSLYNYFRDYDASIGRYIESDPTGFLGGINTYGYVRANPLKWRDPRGLVAERKDPNPYPIVVECPEVPGWRLVDKQVGKKPIKQCFPVYNPRTRKAEMVCLGDGSNNPGTGIDDRGEFGWECVVECVYESVGACGNKQERRVPGTCLRGPKQTGA